MNRKPRFFFKQEEKGKIVNVVKKDFPEEVKRCVRITEKVCNRVYDYYGMKIRFGRDIKWSTMPNGEFEWQCRLNRHYEWPDAAKAYLYTKNKKYLDELIFLINSWIDTEPYDKKWHLLDVAVRATNWVWTYFLLCGEPGFDEETRSKMVKSLEEHGDYLFKHYKDGPQNNWVAMEMEGLLLVSVMFPWMKSSAKWKKAAVRILMKNFFDNVYPDGGQFEMSPSYHTGCLRWYGMPMIFCIKNNIKFPAQFSGRFRKMFYFILHLSVPDGTMPAFGDSDLKDEYKKMMSLGVLIFKDGYMKSCSEFDDIFLWVFGHDAENDYKKIRTKKPAATDVEFKKSGYFITRSGWDKNANYLVFDCGPLGEGHGHVDLLSFCLAVKGKPLLIDPGRYTYMDNRWRKYFKTTSGHNTVTVDNRDQAEYLGSWLYGEPAKYRLLQSVFKKDVTIFEGMHSGYKRLKDPVTHTRKIIFDRKSFLLVIDSFRAKKTHTYRQYFHLPPEVKACKKDRTVFMGFNKEKDFRLDSLSNMTKIDLRQGWISPKYNLKTKAPVICISGTIKGNGAMATLINF